MKGTGMSDGLIINADDFGLTEDTNRAIRELAGLGTLSSTSVMVNMPFAAEIREVAGELPRLGIGVHVNLTTGRPASRPEEVPSLVDGVGEFHSLKELLRRTLRGKVVAREVRREIEAQVSRVREWLGERLDHWDSHEGVHRFEPFASLAMSVCRGHRVPAMRSHRHYFLISRDPIRVLRPSIGTVAHFGWGRLVRESYYGVLSWRAGRRFKMPTGLLALTRGSTLEILQAALSCPLPSGRWEIA